MPTTIPIRLKIFFPLSTLAYKVSFKWVTMVEIPGGLTEMLITNNNNKGHERTEILITSTPFCLVHLAYCSMMS